MRVGQIDGYDVTIEDSGRVEIYCQGDPNGVAFSRRGAQSLVAILLRELGPPSDKLYEAHPDVGRLAFTKAPVEFANGTIPSDARGVVYRVEPGTGSLVYLVKLDDYEDDTSYRPGTRAFNKDQITLGPPAFGFGEASE